MDNKILIFDLKGEHLKQLIRKASRNGSVSSIKEKDVENDRIYKVITMDYMLRKEVYADVLEHSENLVESSILYLSNTLVQHVRRLAQKGETIK
jgi:transposase-like protein